MFDLGVVRTFRSAVSGRPEGLHYIGVENAIGSRSVHDSARCLDVPHRSSRRRRAAVAVRMLCGGFAAFAVGWRDPFDDALRRRSPALGTQRKDDHAVLHLEAHGRATWSVDGRQRDPAPHLLADGRHDTVETNGLAFELGLAFATTCAIGVASASEGAAPNVCGPAPWSDAVNNPTATTKTDLKCMLMMNPPSDVKNWNIST